MAIKASLNHIQINIQDYGKNIDLYKKMFTLLDFTTIYEEEGSLIGVQTPTASIWINPAQVNEKTNRDSDGLNHLGFKVESREDVDKFISEFLKPNNLECLFETPKDRPEFAGETGAYYQVMFELPGSVLCEVVYTA